MKSPWLFVAFGQALLVGCGDRGETLDSATADSTLDTITGRYEFVANPCTIEPCLPGMAYAVLTGDKLYYVTVGDRWFSENKAWNGYTPSVGDVVTLSGRLGQREDVFGKPFNIIETIALRRAK